MTDLTAPITDVTVYADRALITRVGGLQLAAGTHEVRVIDLPAFLRDSLRASGQGPEGTRILAVDITTDFHHRPPEAELLALETERDQLQRQIVLLQSRQEALTDRRQWLRELGGHSRDFAKSLARGQMTPQECAAFLTFTAQQAQEDAEAEQDLNLQVNELSEELAAKERELASKQGYNLPDRLAAVVAIEMPQEGEFTLSLSYLVTQASWRPLYDVRVKMDEDGNQGTVELIYSGQVQQATGEAWEHVNLTLSTARPSQAAILPELQPRYLHALTPPAEQMSLALGSTGRGLIQGQKLRLLEETQNGYMYDALSTIDDERAKAKPAQKQAEVATATTEQSGTVYFFKILRSVDIPSDNEPHKTTIARDELPCEFDYVSAPSLDPVVHLRATITNTTERVLLAGSSSIFLSGDYVGTTQVKQTAPRERFKVFLGIDDTLKIKREQIEHAVEKGALLQGGLRRITYAYRITLTNYAAFPRKVVLRDQLLVSQHERIKLKLLTVQPAPTERTKLELLTWRFSLAAEGEYKVEYRYTIEHPQELQVSGLP